MLTLPGSDAGLPPPAQPPSHKPGPWSDHSAARRTHEGGVAVVQLLLQFVVSVDDQGGHRAAERLHQARPRVPAPARGKRRQGGRIVRAWHRAGRFLCQHAGAGGHAAMRAAGGTVAEIAHRWSLLYDWLVWVPLLKNWSASEVGWVGPGGGGKAGEASGWPAGWLAGVRLQQANKSSRQGQARGSASRQSRALRPWASQSLTGEVAHQQHRVRLAGRQLADHLHRHVALACGTTRGVDGWVGGWAVVFSRHQQQQS